MKQRILAAALSAAIPVTALATPSTVTFDPVHTFTYFSVEHLGLSNQLGRFDRTTGRISLDPAARDGSLEVAIDAASVDTGDSEKNGRGRSRDEHLRSADFFNTAEFPKITYKATHVAFNGDTPASVEGKLTLLGTTQPVALKVERFRCMAAQGTRKERCGGNATARFKRSDFGMKYGIPGVGDEVTLMIAFEGNKE
jgi:polyisoprenoid-binding protein YceI